MGHRIFDCEGEETKEEEEECWRGNPIGWLGVGVKKATVIWVVFKMKTAQRKQKEVKDGRRKDILFLKIPFSVQSR